MTETIIGTICAIVLGWNLASESKNIFILLFGIILFFTTIFLGFESGLLAQKAYSHAFVSGLVGILGLITLSSIGCKLEEIWHRDKKTFTNQEKYQLLGFIAICIILCGCGIHFTSGLYFYAGLVYLAIKIMYKPIKKAIKSCGS